MAAVLREIVIDCNDPRRVAEFWGQVLGWQLQVHRRPAFRLDVMADPAYTVRALDESTWAAFATLVERNDGIFGGCWCMGFHPREVPAATTPTVNRERKLARVRAGTVRDRKIGKHRWVVTRVVEPRS